MFDPIDKIKLKVDELIESPNFLLSKEHYKEYREKTDKFLFNNFYMWSKKKIDIIPNVKSKDKFNRKKMPKKIEIPNLPKNKTDEKYVKEAAKYVDKNFPKNYGNTDDFIFPISHKNAKKWFNNFLDKKLDKFGPYQDFIYHKEPYLYHSCLSSSINIGLLNPTEIINKLKPIKSKFNINSYEGYIRQLFWREYQRYTYIYCDFDKNYFGNKKKLNKKWYTGDLGIQPIDDYIKIAFDTAYLHHIIRLMLIGNFMNLYGISPKEGFKWFMEFSIDSYEWVMKQNVLDMVFFVTGGKTMRRPYASSSNYILKMSTYKKGEWSGKWNELYQNFMKKNKKKLWKFRYHFPGLKKL
jgi:deoxyribodipyrimidine photolyase-related protein